MRIIYRWVEDEPLRSVDLGAVRLFIDSNDHVVEVHAPSGAVAVRHDDDDDD